jgi:hypothetical protein
MVWPGFHTPSPMTRTMGRTRTNAKHSGETLQRNPREIVATQGDRYTFTNREPMMPLCRNGLTRIEGC